VERVETQLTSVDASRDDEDRDIAKGFGRVDHKSPPRRGSPRLRIGAIAAGIVLALASITAAVLIHLNNIPPPCPNCGQAAGSFAPSLSPQDGCADYVMTMASGIASGAVQATDVYVALGSNDPVAQLTVAAGGELYKLQFQFGASDALTRMQVAVQTACAKAAYSSAYSRDVASGNIVPGVFP